MPLHETLYIPLSAPPPRVSRGKKLLAALGIALCLTLTACSTSAAPSECIKAAEAAGLPDKVIEQLKTPGDLNAIERIALRKAMEKAGLDSVCSLGDG